MGGNVVAYYQNLVEIIGQIDKMYENYRIEKQMIEQEFLTRNDMRHIWLIEYQKYYKLKYGKNWNGSLLDKLYLIDV